jgi:sortase A
MRRRGGRRDWIGSLLLVAGVAVLLIAATQRGGPQPVVSTAPSPVETHAATNAQERSSPPATTPEPVTDNEVGAAPLSLARPVATQVKQAGSPPTHLAIPSIGLDQPIVEVSAQVQSVGGQQVLVWNVADYAVGHNDTSADPGQGGNVVLTGHDDWHGEVFRDLHTIQDGAEIVVTTSDGALHRYVVDQILYRQEVGVPLSERLKTGELIGPTADERLTLVTCWPYGIDDQRLIVIARPAP